VRARSSTLRAPSVPWQVVATSKTGAMAAGVTNAVCPSPRMAPLAGEARLDGRDHHSPSLMKFRSHQLAHMRRADMRRAVVAWLARRSTQATRRETSAALGLGHPDSAADMVRRLDRSREQNAGSRRELATTEKRPGKTQNRA